MFSSISNAFLLTPLERCNSECVFCPSSTHLASEFVRNADPKEHPDFWNQDLHFNRMGT